MSSASTNENTRRTLSDHELDEILACPSCRARLQGHPGQTLTCPGCAATFAPLRFGWDFTDGAKADDADWQVWEQLQDNGVVSYTEDPEHNLGVGAREDYTEFARFAGFHGLVLDVGCGPQPWPTHFSLHAPGTRFVGVDPLVGEEPAEYTQIRALGERLPFRSGVFDQVAFATSLDHFVDPVAALAEAGRVVRADGSVEVFLGEKSADAPPPSVTHDWYEALSQPPGADDVFHIKRLDAEDARGLFEAARLTVADHRRIEIDKYRSIHFFKLEPENAG